MHDFLAIKNWEKKATSTNRKFFQVGIKFGIGICSNAITIEGELSDYGSLHILNIIISG